MSVETDVERREATDPIPVVTLADFDREPPTWRDVTAVYQPRRRRFTEAERAGIVARIEYAELPWRERWLAPRPPTWEQTTDRYR